jgi:hypothetical protein
MLRATKALFAVAVATTLLLVLTILLHSNKVLAIPLGFMTFFDAEKCPRGWSLYAEAQGRLIVSVDNPNNAGITVGVPLGDREDRTHTHSFTFTGHLPHLNISGAPGSNNNNNGARHGNVTTRLISGTSSSGLPFTQLLLCQISTLFSTDLPTVGGTIGFFDPSLNACPHYSPSVFGPGSTWKTIPALTGRVAVPGNYADMFFNNNAPSYSSAEDRKHKHTSNSVRVAEQQVFYASNATCCDSDLARFESSIKFEGDSSSESSNLPYVQLLTCVSNDFGDTDLSLPEGALVFTQGDYEGECPPNWEIATESAGRLLVALPTGGKPGAFFGGPTLNPTGKQDPLHKHNFNRSMWVDYAGVEVESGTSAGPYSSSGSFPFVGTSTQSDADVPITFVPLCRQISDRKRSGKSVLAKEYAKHKEQKMIEGMKKH